MKKRMLIMLLLAAVVFGGIFGYKGFVGYMMQKSMAGRGLPPQTVSTAVAGYQQWQPTIEAVGTLHAEQGADLSPEVSGIVAAVHFRQGDDVDAGALLAELDAASDRARLSSLQAVAKLAASTYERDRLQFRAKAISRQALDASAAALAEARANVAEQQALVEKKTIRAPFAGRLGIRSVDPGQYVQPGTVIVTLQSLDPLYVDFFLPQQSLSQLHVGQAITATTDSWPGETFTGTVAVIDPKVDAATRNVRVRAKLANPGKKLLPGMYATVDIIAGSKVKRLTLPQTAISYNPYGDIVYLVEKAGGEGKAKLVARQVFVTTGETRGDQVAVLKGIKAGDTVVTTGQLKLRNGSPLIVDNRIVPSNAAHPQPRDE